MNSRLRGLVAATHTPFHSDGSLNVAAVEQQAELLLRNGVTTVFIGGSTGESHSLSLDERRRLAERWIAVARGTAITVVVHVGANCLADSRDLAAQAGRLGAVAVAALSPSYFKPDSVATLQDCCAYIASAAPQTPFYYYDIPSLTGVSFPMPAFLAGGRQRIPNLAGIKFTQPDLMAYQMCLHADGGAFDVLWGCDEYLLAALSLGGLGAVGSSYNFAAPLYNRLLKAFAAGDLESARREQYRSVQLIQTLAAQGYMGSAKAVMKMLGVDVGPARLPNTNPSDTQLAELKSALERIGFFEWGTK